jgi:multiple sugar transport system ATP-binding protein
MARLDLEGLSKVFPVSRARNAEARGVVAVRDFSLSVADGELLVLLGPSGCGKTTTLRLIAGLEQPTAGDVRIAGVSVKGLPPEKRDVAMVFPRGALYPHLSVEQNLAWGARLRDRQGWFAWFELLGRLKVGRWLKSHRLAKAVERSAERQRRVRSVAEQLGIAALLERLPSQLSDGQRQRVALGRAMVRDPSVYLMDEPLTGLDAPLRSQLRRELREWQQSVGATVVYVTHDQTEALLLGDRLAVMNEAALQQIGSPQEVYERPKNRFVAGFVGSPAMNLIEGELSSEPEGSLVFRAGEWSLPVMGGDGFTPERYLTQEHFGRENCRRIVLGVRPEHVLLEEPAAGIAPGGPVNCTVRLAESAGDVRFVYVGPLTTPAKDAGQSEGRQQTTQLMIRSGSSNHLTVKWQTAEMPRPGDAVRVWLDPRRLHWFDAASGENLTLPQSG